MNSENAAQIHAFRQLEALMAEIYKAEDRRKKQRRERVRMIDVIPVTVERNTSWLCCLF